MTERSDSFRLATVEAIPRQLDSWVLYHAPEYSTAVHSCPCGCGSRIVTPLKAGFWSLTVDTNGQPTLDPSIGAYDYGCGSHYWIIHGTVAWGGSISTERLELLRQSQHALRDALNTSPPGTSVRATAARLWERLTRLIRR